MDNLNGSRAINNWPYNWKLFSDALYAFKGQFKWVVGPWQDYSTSITLYFLPNTPRGNISKNRNVRQLEWLSNNITTWPYNWGVVWGVPNALYANESHYNGSSTTPPTVAKASKIIPMGNLNGCRAVTTWPYNYRGVPNALYAFTWQCKNGVVGLRHDYSTSITP